MTKFGQISAYDEKTGRATVTFVRPDACAKCGACGLKAQTGSAELTAEGCRVGQWVRVEMPEGRFLRATALAYALPLAGLLAGLGCGYWLGDGGDGPTVLGGAVGLALPWLVLRLNERRISARPEWSPRITARYDDKPTQAEIGCERS